MNASPYQMHFSMLRSSLDARQMTAMICPSSLSSGCTSSALFETAPDTRSSGFVTRSTDNPRHPAARLSRPNGGDRSPLLLCAAARRCASTFPTNTASYRCHAAEGMGAGRVSGRWMTGGFADCAGRTLDIDVREVAVLMIEERSEDEVIVEVTELRFDGGAFVREGGGGGGVALTGGGRTT